jgi:hypothetical protein
MKFNIIKILLLLNITLILALRIDDYNKNKKDKKPVIVNVQMEQPDREPLEVKRIEEERRIERDRIRDLEEIEEADKRSIQKVLNSQNKLLEKLSSIAEKTTKIIDHALKFPLASLRSCNEKKKIDFSFKQTRSFLKNGPIA